MPPPKKSEDDILLKRAEDLHGQGKLNEADALFEQVVKRLSQTTPHARLVTALTEAAECNFALGHRQSGEQLFGRALAVYNEIGKTPHLETAVCADRLANYCASIRHYVDADKLMHDSVAMTRAIKGGPSLEESDRLSDWAQIMIGAVRGAETERILELQRQISKAIGQADSPWWHARMCCAYAMQGKYQEAVDEGRHADKMLKDCDARTREAVICSLFPLYGVALGQRHLYKDAEDVWKRVIEVQSKWNLPKVALAQANTELARNLHEQNRDQEAALYSKRAKDLLQSK
jgi:tetratricopeptide (TPR) repeat protein